MKQVKEVSYDDKNRHKIGIKNFHIQIENYLNNNKDCVKDEYTKDDIIRIMSKMAVKGYYLTFVNSKNIISILNFTRKYLNRDIIVTKKYIKNLE